MQMSQAAGTTGNGRRLWFWLGVLAILAGVLSHVPMFWMGRHTNWEMVGMPMDGWMWAGMVAIVVGNVLAFVGVMPRGRAARSSLAVDLHLRAIDDAPLTAQHWKVFATLVVAIIIDVMKPATLAFVVPGMRGEYALSREVVALFPLSALIGTTVGSLMWGWAADVIGRRAVVLLSALMFIGTSICAAMPTFEWNLVMCFLMGMSAGGLLPIAFTLIAEIAPSRHRGWLMVLAGGIGTAGGYLAASANAAALEPLFGWRALWLAGIPTGLLLIVLNRYIPESPRFLCLRGHLDEARAVLARFGVQLEAHAHASVPRDAASQATLGTLFRGSYAGLTFGLALCGVAWGLVNFGFFLWLPDTLRGMGLSAEMVSGLLTRSALLAFPGILLVTWMYQSWSSHKTLVVFALMVAACLFVFVALDDQLAQWPSVLLALMVVLLITTAAVVSVLLPYGAEVYPLRVRASGAGIVAASSKLGGILGACLGFFALVSGLAAFALIAAVPIALAALVLAYTGVETRGRALEDVADAKLGIAPAKSWLRA